MLSPDSQPFSNAFFVWLIGGSLSVLLFALGVQRPKLPNRGFAASVGASACFVSMAAITEITRNGMNPTSSVGTIAIYVIGIGLSLIVSFFYAFFFMFWHAKNF